METSVGGIHHVTMIAGDPRQNLDFYASVLGLRLIKKSVNQDDPGTYHLYFGDERGHPGTILTFFPWPGARKGRQGAGQAAVLCLSIPESALGYWMDRLVTQQVRFDGPERRFDEQVLSFRDPDGLALELIAVRGAAQHPGWGSGPIPVDHAIRGVHGVTLWEQEPGPTVNLLTSTLGFRPVEQDGNRRRFEAGNGGPGALVDVVSTPGFWRGVVSVGTVHHVAWRTANDDSIGAWRDRVAPAVRHVTPLIDRFYFRSIYFREPGGVLFEIATDGPGFTVDESPEELGTHLVLPPWLEPSREEIERALPALDVAIRPKGG